MLMIVESPGSNSWLSIAGDISSIFATLGALSAVIWAIRAHYLNNQSATVGSFRRLLSECLLYLRELSVGFQNLTIEVLLNIFNENNPNYDKLMAIGEHAIQLETDEAIEQYLEENDSFLRSYIVYSIPPELQNRIDIIPSEFQSKISPLLQYSPVLHLMFRDAGRSIVRVNSNELDIDHLHKYIKTAVPFLKSEMSENGGNYTRKELHSQWRSYLSSIITYYNDDYSFMDVISELVDLIDNIVNVYRENTISKIWKHHKMDINAPIDRLDVEYSYCETFKKVIDWKLSNKRYKHAYELCNKNIENLKVMKLDPEESTTPDNPPEIE